MSSRHPRGAALVRLGGWVHLGRAISGVSSLVAAAFALSIQDAGWLIACSLSGLVWAIFALLHAFETNRLRCPHCEGALFKSPKRTERRPALPALRTAAQAALCPHYRCHHCGHQNPSCEGDGWRTPSRGSRQIVLHSRIPKR